MGFCNEIDIDFYLELTHTNTSKTYAFLGRFFGSFFGGEKGGIFGADFGAAKRGIAYNTGGAKIVAKKIGG